MSQSLRRDLELLATFDSDHTDAGNGVVKDFSGKERHLEASGGPTYGQPSPVGEAVGFDGTDDEFVSVQSDDFDVPLNGAVTVHVLLRTSTDQSASANGPHIVSTAQEKAVGNRDGWNVGIDGNNRFKLAVEDINDNVESVSAPASVTDGKYRSCTGIIDLQNDRLIAYNEDGVRQLTGLSVNSEVAATQSLRVGHGRTGSFYTGDIAFAGVWSRALSDAEIDELNRMTDRMVSRL